MKTLPKDSELKPETWTSVQEIAFGVSVTCSNGHTFILKNHMVDSEGRVRPIVHCPHDTCEWQADLILQDWSDE